MLNVEEKQILEKAFAKVEMEVLSLAAAEEISAAVGFSLKKVEYFALYKEIVPERYQRNIGTLGIEGQKKLLQSSCVVIGLGGLGGFVCEELARLGIGAIAGVDFDSFEQSNLNRQLNSILENLSRKKAIETRRRIQQINKSVEFEPMDLKFTGITDRVWQEADIVFDCLDNINDRLILARECSKYDKPLIHGAVAGWNGQVSVVWPKSDTLDEIYKNQTEGMEKKVGTPVFTVATVASIMISEGVKILTGKKIEKERKIHFFDLMQDIWQIITL